MHPDWLSPEPVFRPGMSVKLMPGNEDVVRANAAKWSDAVGVVEDLSETLALVMFPDVNISLWYQTEWLQPVQPQPQDENLAA